MTAPHAPTFDQLHHAATGRPPHPDLARIAETGLPAQISVPAGSGKTGVILAWLWRRLYGPDPVIARTPRRLIWALPQRSPLEPTAEEVKRWLAALELSGSVALHVALGTRSEDVGDWRENMHRPAIVVGTVDTLVSKALNRGYGTAAALYPIDFALVTNGAHWVIDEARLCPQSTTTLRQLAGYAAEAGTAEPFGLTLVSTVPDLAAPRTFRRLAASPGDYRTIAASALECRARGTRTLIVLNTVDAAQQVYRQLRGGPVDVTLLHSRFRGAERAGRLRSIQCRVDDLIIVATQVVEAGIGDLGAALLITEAAPWPSLILRVRHGDRGEVFWVPPPGPLPYSTEDIDAVAAELIRLEDRPPIGEEFTARDALFPPAGHRAVIRPSEFVRLFDTSTYLSDDIDIAPYVRDTEDLDVEVAWASWTRGEDGAPDPEVRFPPAEYRCRVGLAEVLKLAEDRIVWRFDQVAGAWTQVSGQAPSHLRPGELLLVDACDGGYDQQTGFDPLARGFVAESPVLLTADEQAAQADDALDPVTVAPRTWQSLDEHSERVRDQAAVLLAVIAPRGLPAGAARSAVIAGWLHDVGKAHPIWQDALCSLAGEDEWEEIAKGRPWAKSGGRTGRLEFAGDVPFRHELASLLLVGGPLRELLGQAPDQDLARFLVVAHHGQLRVQIREHADPPDPAEPAAFVGGEPSEMQIRGLRQDVRYEIPPMLGHPVSTLTIDLGQFTAEGEGSWTSVVLGLLAKYGPFRLAYLETIVRIADWRASGGRELATR